MWCKRLAGNTGAKVMQKIAENTGRKKVAKNRHLSRAPSHKFVGLYLRN